MVGEAVGHPLRARILEVLNQRDMEPVEFVHEGLADFFMGARPGVSLVAYHFTELAKYGCLEAVAQRKASGSIATTYRGVARLLFEGEEWAALSASEKERRSRLIAQGLIARIEGALTADTFNSREDRQLSWFAMQVDEQGWGEVSAVLTDAYDAVRRIHTKAAARLRQAGDNGVSGTAGIASFESPAPGARRNFAPQYFGSDG